MVGKRNLPLDELEKEIDYHFIHRSLLEKALRHRSAARSEEKRKSRKKRLSRFTKSNERLEFVGDRVLGLVVAELLFEYCRDEPEGELGVRLAHLVSRSTLAVVAQTLELGNFIQVAKQEARDGVHFGESVTADAMEAILGAIFLDGGFDNARRIIRRFWLPILKANPAPPREPKTVLQEISLRDYKKLPTYELHSTSGTSHEPVFVMRACVGPNVAFGQGGSKREAERKAAIQILEKMNASYTPFQGH